MPELSPAKLVSKVIEYAQELGLVFRKPRWNDEVNKVCEDFCKALAAVVGVPNYDCRKFVVTGTEMSEAASLFDRIADRELREALWRIFQVYAAEGYVPSVLAGSKQWPKNTRMLGRIPRTPWRRSDGIIEYYYKLTWQEFFETFVGRLVADERRTFVEETNSHPDVVVSGGDVVSPLCSSLKSTLIRGAVSIFVACSSECVKSFGRLTTSPPLTTNLPNSINENFETPTPAETAERRKASDELTPVKLTEAPPDSEVQQANVPTTLRNPAEGCLANPTV